MSKSADPTLRRLRVQLGRRHLAVGWGSLLLFLLLGVLLESLHALKAGFYLDPDHSIRREMWRLAHAHGTLLAVVQILFGLSLPRLTTWVEKRLKITSHFLINASLLIPLGFFLGGIGHSEGDPSWGVFLVPVGALLLVVSVGSILAAALVANLGGGGSRRAGPAGGVDPGNRARDSN